MDYKDTRIAIKHWAEDDRPREKLIMKGSLALSDAELLAILIGKGTRKYSAVDLGKIVLKAAGQDINKLAQLDVEELTRIEGIGKAKAVGIIAAMELARRRRVEKPGEKVFIHSSEGAYEHMKQFMTDLWYEEFWVLCLNRRMQVLKTVKVSTGGLSGTYVDLRVIFRHALQNKSNAILLCHNHPSGTLEPSEADFCITQKIKAAASQYLDIIVSDHIIFTNEGYYSFADNGIL